MSMKETRNNAATTRGRPFAPGNPGRPKGSRHKMVLAMEALLDGEGEVLTRKAIELAKDGDLVALRLCLDRILPVRKDRPVAFAMPALEKAADAAKAIATITEAVAASQLTPMEAADMSKLVETFTRALEATEFEVRLARLEEIAKV